MTEKYTMAKFLGAKSRPSGLRRGKPSLALVVLLSLVLALPGCFDPVYPQLDREARIMEALEQRDNRSLPAGPLSAADAVAYALANNLDSRVAEIEASYQNESLVAARRRLLPTLTARYSLDHTNHPSARWSESTKSGNQSLESSYSSDPNARHGEVSAMWNLIDFGVGYLRSRQQGERVRYTELQRRRVRQQVVLDVLTYYWRAAAAQTIAQRAEAIKKELDDQAEAIRDSVEMRILSNAEGARRELAVHGGLAELEQWRRGAVQARLELARVMGCGSATDLVIADFPADPPRMPALIESDPQVLQTAALKRRPELYQHDAQERIAVDEARVALLQMAPTANLSLNLHSDPDKFLEWNDWMTAGVRVTWNLFNIPARLSERRMAKLQGEVARQKGLALAVAVMAQVGIAYSDWRLSHDYANTLYRRADARERLVEALAAGEKDNQTRPGEVLQERVRLLSEQSAAMRAAAETRVAGARLANAIGIEANDLGQFVWDFKADVNGENYEQYEQAGKSAILYAESKAAEMFPNNMAGLRVVKAEEFLTPDVYFEEPARRPKPAPESRADSAESAAKKAQSAAKDDKKKDSKAKTPAKTTARDKAKAKAKAAAEAKSKAAAKEQAGKDGAGKETPPAKSGAVDKKPDPGKEPEDAKEAPPEDTENTVKKSTAESDSRTKIAPAKKLKPGGPPNVAGKREPAPVSRSLPEDLQALRPSADSFGESELRRNDFIDMRAAPAPAPAEAYRPEPIPSGIVPSGSLRPEGGSFQPEAMSLRPAGDAAPEGSVLFNAAEKASLRPPAQETATKITLPAAGPENLSWEERRMQALEPLRSLE